MVERLNRPYALQVWRPVLKPSLGCLGVVWCCLCAAPAQAEDGQTTLEFSQCRTAALDPAEWDQAFVGKLYFDALRPLLVQFPGLAEQVHAKLAEGYEVERVELRLKWTKTEGARPQRGRHGWGAEKAYTNYPGKWSVVARPILKPWTAEPGDLAPTFNAYLPGAGFWARGGAREPGKDVGKTSFGPAPLHLKATEAVLDVTPLLTGKEYAENLGHRLRALEQNGLLLHKHELIDMRYVHPDWTHGGHEGSYDWRVGTGYMRIWVEMPRLVVTLKKAAKPAEVPALPPRMEMARLAAELKAAGGDGTPSICVPPNLKQLAEQYPVRPDGLPDWQWEHARELWDLGFARAAQPRIFPGKLVGVGGEVLTMFHYGLFGGSEENYRALLQRVLTIAPRHFTGHKTTDYAIAPILYGELMPPGLKDHLQLYWQAFCHPELEDTRTIERRAVNYFRGYCRVLGPMNFNYNSTAGTLLAGQLLKAPHVLRDARWGLEHLLLRTYAVNAGSYQEMGETYYPALSLVGAGAIANLANDPLDQLMGRVARDRLVGPLVSAYHPGLRRIVHPQCRGNIPNQVLFQDGPYHVLHTLSRAGAMVHLDEARAFYASGTRGRPVRHEVPVLGTESPPDRSAVFVPWGEEFLANIIDDKPLPWLSAARHWAREPQSHEPGWHLSYLGENYGLSSREDGSVAPIVAHWRRAPETVTCMEDYGTLLLSSGFNGRFRFSSGFFGTMQHKNKALTLRVLRDPKWLGKTPKVHSLHTSVAILAFGDTSAREVWINGRKIESLSGARPSPGGKWHKRLATAGERVFARDGDVIAISDGVSYVGLIPFAANAPERSQQVELSFEYPLLLVHTFMYRSDQPMKIDEFYGAKQKASAGFVIEVADRTEFGSFAAFRRHLGDAELTTAWNAEAGVLEARYASSGDRLAMDFRPQVHQYATPHSMGPKPVRRTINGKWPYLPKGIHRDTPWSVQGVTGRIEKAGAELRAEPGRRVYLQAETKSGTYVAYNVLPDPTLWSFRVPGGVRLDADGRLGIARVQVRPGQNRIWIDHAAKPEHRGREDLASAILVFGLKQAPEVVLGGTPLKEAPKVLDTDGVNAYAIPLRGKLPAPGALATRHARARKLLDLSNTPAVLASYLQDWRIIGPFPSDQQGTGMETVYPPEQELNFAATYEGLDDTPARWRRAIKEGQPALGAEPVSLLQFFPETTQFAGYAHTQIISKREQAVSFWIGIGDLGRTYTGWVKEPLGLWLNGKRVFLTDAYESPGRDGHHVNVTLKEGKNSLLVKFSHAKEPGSLGLYLRVGDAWGFPCPPGVMFGKP